MNAPTDDELTARAMSGNRQALEELVVRYQPWIYNIAFRMVLVREDAEDITQEIVIKMLTKLSTYDPGKASFRTWLYRIVANHVINMKTRGYEKAALSFEAYHSAYRRCPG
jgi:RNA polymerase sigma factor (sigma-70 family)